MGLETVVNVNDLVAANPVSNTDTVASMAPHIRNIKIALLQDISDGSIMIKGTGQTSGTADAMTISFSPSIPLADFATIFVRAAGQITTTTPTISVNGSAAKTIVKRNNEPLVLEDIVGVQQLMILQYRVPAVDKWFLLNPASTGLGAALSGYSRAGTYYSYDGSIAYVGIGIETVIGAAYETIGPTGSGATNIWTALDVLPLNATAVDLHIRNRLDGATTASTYISQVTGRVINTIRTREMSVVRFTNRSGSLETGENISTGSMAIDATNQFELAYSSSGTSPVPIVSLNLVGFWV